MHKTLLISFLFLSQFLFTQQYFGVKLGGNYPVNYTSNELYRKFGSELGIFYCRQINNTFYFETGFDANVWGRKDVKITYTTGNNFVDSSIFKYSSASNMNFGFNVPLLLNFKLKKGLFELKSGIVFTGRNVFIMTDYSGYDPELTYISDIYSPRTPLLRKYGFDFRLEGSYKIYKGMRAFCHFQTPINVKASEYGVFAMGLNYCFE